jgi:hypothetical protein
MFSVLVTLLATTTIANAAGSIDACVNPGNGNLRLVDAATPCHANETRVQWSIVGPSGATGPAGPSGPSGPSGPAGATGLTGPAGASAGGPPYVWACTPANYFSGGSTNATVFVFNGSASAANVAIHILNKDGSNLAGHVVPGAAPIVPGDPAPTFPGQIGSATVSLAAGGTMVFGYQTAVGNPASGGDIPATVRIVSDQPIVAGANVEFSGFHPMTCGYVAH